MSELTEDHEHPDRLLLAMIEKLQPYGDRATQDEPFSIYRVPPSIREADPSAYQPQIISIGPYHHKDPRLQAMEDHKWRYMHNLLARRPQTDQSDFTTALKGCIEKVKQSETRARGYYSVPNDLISDEFVMMMVLDGCFILELILTIKFGTETDDPIHSAPWMLTLVWRDLLKLENQIPFFVLEDLFNIAAGRCAITLSLKKLTIKYLKAARAFTRFNHFGKKQVVYHLLHFYDLLLQPTAEEDTDPSIINTTFPSSSAKSIIRKMNSSFASCSNCILHISEKSQPIVVKGPQTTIPCVVQLGEAGIKFRRKLDDKSCLNVTFRDGTLEIPCLRFTDSINPLFRNLIAFEQCCPYAGQHITCYMTFLDCVINTAKDVAILQQRGIIENLLGSEEEVAQFINQLGKGVTVDYSNHYLEKAFEELNEYCESNWHKHRARLARDYFGNPWASVSVVAAAALLLMTLAQVVFAVLSYQKQ